MSARTTIQETARKVGVLVAYPMIASEIVYKGTPTFTKTATGLAFSNDGTTNTVAAGDKFVGISAETGDNSAGAASDISVDVYRKGNFLLTFSDTLSQASVGVKVYTNNASDDAVVTTTTDTGNAQATIGTIAEFVSASTAYVQIDNYVDTAVATA